MKIAERTRKTITVITATVMMPNTAPKDNVATGINTVEVTALVSVERQHNYTVTIR